MVAGWGLLLAVCSGKTTCGSWGEHMRWSGWNRVDKASTLCPVLSLAVREGILELNLYTSVKFSE